MSDDFDLLPHKHQCSPENAANMLSWIKTRGGIAIWSSVNMSNPGASWSTPYLTKDGSLMLSPTWQAEKNPSRVVTDPGEVVVVTPRVVKRFHVAVRVGSQGLQAKLTVASSRKVRDAVAKAGDGAWYEFDYGEQEAVILVPGETVSLEEWVASHV